MRKWMIAAVLSMAAGHATASVEFKALAVSANMLTLTNGCTYAPRPDMGTAIWAFLRAAPDTLSACPAMVREKRTKPMLQPRYLVGVYR